VIFYTSGLLSKWGLSDGDLLWDLLCEHGYRYAPDAEGGLDAESATLARVIEEHVAPKLDQDVETYRIPTCHNPIRAGKVDGVKVQHPDDDRFTLTPEAVEVPDEVILAIAAEEWARVKAA
jgi:hypothetical protein